MNKKLFKISVAAAIVCCQLMSCVHGPQVKGPVAIASQNTVDLDISNFDSLIVTQSGKAVVEFYSPICKACQAMVPIYDSIGLRFKDSLLVARVDADAQRGLCDKYDIVVVPSFVFFSDGVVIRTDTMTANETGFDTLSERIHDLLDGTLTPATGDTGEKKDTVSSWYITIDSLSFDTTVLGPGKVAMVFFMVPTGLPCIHMDSVVNHIAPQFEERAVIAKVIVVWNVEPLTQRYGINQVPRFLFFKDGVWIEEEMQQPGIYEGDTLVAVLERLLE